MLLPSYLEARECLLGTMERAVGIARGRSLDQAATNLEMAWQGLKSNRFNVVVMGQLKRGKSTVVNALLRKAGMMPADVIPVSSAIVRVSYGSTERMTVRFKDGRPRELMPISCLGDYCDEQKNSQNRKGVSEIVVEYPSDWLKDGVSIVDTPGEGSIHSYHSEIVYEFIPRADAILFLFTTDCPISKGEYDFLSKIANHGIKKVLFIMNKADHIKLEEEKERLYRYNLEKIRGIEGFGDLPETGLYLLSAHQAMEDIQMEGKPGEGSGFPQMEERLRRLLLDERASTTIDHGCRALERVIRDVLSNIDLEREALKTTIEEMHQKLDRLRREKSDITQNLNTSLGDFEEAVERANSDFEKDLRLMKSDLERWARQSVQGASAFNIRNAAREIQSQIEERMREQLEDLVEGCVQQHILPACRELQSGIERQLRRLAELGETIHVESLKNISFESAVEGFFPVGGALQMAGGAGLLLYGVITQSATGIVSAAWSWIFGQSAIMAATGPVGWALLGLGAITCLWSVSAGLHKTREEIVRSVSGGLDEFSIRCRQELRNSFDGIMVSARQTIEGIFRMQLEPVEQALIEAVAAERFGRISETQAQLKEHGRQIDEVAAEVRAIREIKL